MLETLAGAIAEAISVFPAISSEFELTIALEFWVGPSKKANSDATTSKGKNGLLNVFNTELLLKLVVSSLTAEGIAVLVGLL